MPRPDIDILIIGAGVLGLASAAELTRRGHALVVVDPGGRNASSVAAGMIAPAFESVAEDCTPDRAAFLRRARDLWPDFARGHGLNLNTVGAVWCSDDAASVADRLTALGFRARVEDGVATTDEDLHIDPEPALASLSDIAEVLPGTIARIELQDGKWRALGEGLDLTARRLLIATGVAPALPGLPASVADLIADITPIRGQIGHAAGERVDHIVRGPDGYVAPAPDGLLVGATMEPGRRDLEPDAATSHQLKATAEQMLGRSLGPVDWHVGIRGASPDGLPIAGPADADIHLALAPRRNGWLLAPLIARIVADGIEGQAPDADAQALSPSRFVSRG